MGLGFIAALAHCVDCVISVHLCGGLGARQRPTRNGQCVRDTESGSLDSLKTACPFRFEVRGVRLAFI
jgi:hypothetical protein